AYLVEQLGRLVPVAVVGGPVRPLGCLPGHLRGDAGLSALKRHLVELAGEGPQRVDRPTLLGAGLLPDLAAGFPDQVSGLLLRLPDNVLCLFLGRLRDLAAGLRRGLAALAGLILGGGRDAGGAILLVHRTLLCGPRRAHSRPEMTGYPLAVAGNGPTGGHRARPACDREEVNLPPLDLGQLVGQAQARPGVLVAVVLVAAGYLVGGGRGPGWPRGRTAAFLAGLLVVLLATCTGIEAYGHVLEWMHMVEHLLL